MASLLADQENRAGVARAVGHSLAAGRLSTSVTTGREWARGVGGWQSAGWVRTLPTGALFSKTLHPLGKVASGRNGYGFGVFLDRLCLFAVPANRPCTRAHPLTHTHTRIRASRAPDPPFCSDKVGKVAKCMKLLDLFGKVFDTLRKSRQSVTGWSRFRSMGVRAGSMRIGGSLWADRGSSPPPFARRSTCTPERTKPLAFS